MERKPDEVSMTKIQMSVASPAFEDHTAGCIWDATKEPVARQTTGAPEDI